MRKSYKEGLFLILLILINSYAFGSVRTLSLGSGAVTKNINPAASVLEVSSINTFYTNNFGIKDYETKGVGLNYHIGKTAFGFNYFSEGGNVYEQRTGRLLRNHIGTQEIGGQMGFRLSNSLSLGVGLKTQKLSATIDGENTTACSALVVDLGIINQGANSTIGFVVRRPLSDRDDLVNPYYTLGVSFGSTKEVGGLLYNLNVSLDETGAYQNKISFHGGIEARFQKNITLRFGIDKAKSITCGLGFAKGKWNFNYAYKFNTVGNSSFIDTTYNF